MKREIKVIHEAWRESDNVMDKLFDDPELDGKPPLYLVSWGLGNKSPDVSGLDVTKFPEDKRELLREAARLIKAQRDIDEKEEYARLREEARNR